MDLDDDGLQLLQPRNSSVSVVHWEAFASLRCEKRSLRKGPVGHSVPDSRNNSAGSFSYAAAGRGQNPFRSILYDLETFKCRFHLPDLQSLSD
jgi:hypothetical protein